MTPCRPKHPAEQCGSCQRLSRNLPHEAEDRPTTLLLDVRAILPDDADCPMFIEVARQVYWWQQPEEVNA